MVLSLILFGLICIVKGNPYIGKEVYILEEYINNVSMSINLHPTESPQLAKYQYVPVFYWVDTITKITNLSNILQSAMNQQIANNSKVLVQIVIFDLPNRDCDGLIPRPGDFTCKDDECVQGIQEYEQQYIDPIVSIIQKYPDLTIVAIIEPYALDALVRNSDTEACYQAQTAYLTGIPYAIKELNKSPNVYQYVGAGWSGTLGYPNNMLRFIEILQQVLQTAGGMDKIQGFSTNIGSIYSLGSVSSYADPCHLQENYNPAINEAIYIQILNQKLYLQGIMNKTYITDTSRNGKIPCNMAISEYCGNPCCELCNVKGCQFGPLPSTNTNSTGIGNLIDSFVWIHVPQLSDGTSNASSSDFVPVLQCNDNDFSLSGAPGYNYWFDEYFVMLATAPAPTADNDDIFD